MTKRDAHLGAVAEVPMSGYYPDGLDQSGFDEYWANRLGDDEKDELICDECLAVNGYHRNWCSAYDPNGDDDNEG